MRHKIKKEPLDVIVQKMTNDTSGNYLADLLKVAEIAKNEKRAHGRFVLSGSELQENVRKMEWLYGYESEIQEAFEYLKSKMEKKVFNKDSSHRTIVSCMVYYCTLSSILNPKPDDTAWDEMFAQCESKKVLECLEILKRHCAEKIDVQGFFEARRYIRIWDSEFNW